MNSRIIYLILFFSLISISLLSSIVYADVQFNYPYDYCELKAKNYDYNGVLQEVVFWCSEDVLFSDYGLYISIPIEYNFTAVRFFRSYDLTKLRWVIIIIVNRFSTSIFVNLPVGREYAGIKVSAWNLTFYYEVNNSYAMSNIILTPTSWETTKWEIPVDFTIVQVELKPANMSNIVIPAPSLPEWHDVGGWANFLVYLVSEVGKAIPTALSIFANAVMYLLQISPFLLLIIPLHIVFSFIEDPSRGISTINFYVSLARKFIDLLVKIAHAIVDLIGHIIPF
jgi:hypothetical protein